MGSEGALSCSIILRLNAAMVNRTSLGDIWDHVVLKVKLGGQHVEDMLFQPSCYHLSHWHFFLWGMLGILQSTQGCPRVNVQGNLRWVFGEDVVPNLQNAKHCSTHQANSSIQHFFFCGGKGELSHLSMILLPDSMLRDHSCQTLRTVCSQKHAR